jgi:hypothetical protein
LLAMAKRKERRQWERHMFQDAPRQLAEEAVTKAVAAVRCPTHGRNARVKTVKWSGDNLEAQVEGCCAELVARAQAAIGS